MQKHALAAALCLALAACASAPVSTYRPPMTRDAWAISGAYTLGAVSVTINGTQVISGAVNPITGSGTLSGTYDGRPITASCSMQGVWDPTETCQVFVAGELADTLEL